MLKCDHLSIPVSDANRSRNWYVDTLGMTIEFEVPERHLTALQDSHGFTIFLHEVSSTVAANGCALWFQVAEVDATFAEWSARGISLSHSPHKFYWGYGAELVDPDGYLIRLWDQRSMKEK